MLKLKSMPIKLLQNLCENLNVPEAYMVIEIKALASLLGVMFPAKSSVEVRKEDTH